VVWHHLGGDAPQDVSPLQDAVVWRLRMPRVLLAVLVGAGLAVTGAVLQTLTDNPLADPYLLGISSGASFGAVLVVVAGVGAGAWSMGSGAFAGAAVAIALVLLLGSKGGRLSPLRMVLAGVAVAQLCGAALSFVILWAANRHATMSVEFWLAGSITRATWPVVTATAVVVVAALVICLGFARGLDALVFGEDAAITLGVPVSWMRWVLVVVTAALTAVLVSVSGSVGFVGLVLPHAARFLVGPAHRALLPVTALAGGTFVLWADTLARTVFAPREVPVGLLTALVGVPAFLIVLRRATFRS
jgi:iron complex transport system permease protein